MKMYTGPREFERYTIENFASEIISHQENSVQSLTDRVHEYFKTQGVRSWNIVRAMVQLQEQKENGTQCIQESPQQMLISLYSTAVATEVKAFALVKFSYMLFRLYGKGNFIHESAELQEKYIRRMQEKTTSMRDGLDRVSRKLWMCDPEKYMEGKNYYDITRLLQGYIRNEVDLSKDGSCEGQCSTFAVTKDNSMKWHDSSNYLSKQQFCHGQVYDCKFVEDSNVCLSFSNRRYEYVESVDGQKNSKCSGLSTTVSSWLQWVVFQCSYCMCLCDDQSKSDRFVNLRPVLTNIEFNKVATGLRFVKVGRVVHLQIQEGKLGQRGHVYSLSWVPIVSYDIRDKDVRDGVDYHTLTFLHRSLNLDDVETGAQNKVLTGVRLQLHQSRLYLEVRLTSFDFVSGQLRQKDSNWFSNNHTTSRQKLDLAGRDIPTKTKDPSLPGKQSNKDKYLEFTHTDFQKDAAQTTVPFFDGQDVVPETAVPLAGAGIYYKGRKGYGGFVAPKLITFNYHALLENAIDDLKLEEVNDANAQLVYSIA